jgi:hypothetical protein
MDNFPELSWFVIGLPIWVLLTQSAVRDILKYAYQTPRMTVHYLIFRMGYDICLCLATLSMCLRLSGIIPTSTPWVIVLIPLWIDGIFNSLYLAMAPGPGNVDDETLREYRSNMWYAALIHFGTFGLQAGLIALKVDGYVRGSWSNIFIPSFLALIFLVIALAGTSLHLMGVFCPSCLRLRTLIGAQRVVFGVLMLLALLAWMWLVCVFQSFEALVSALSDPKSRFHDYMGNILLPLIIVISATVVLLPLLVAGLVAAGVNQSALAAAAGRGNGRMEDSASLIPLVNSVLIVRQSSMYFKRVTDLLINTTSSQDSDSQYGEDRAEMGENSGRGKFCYVCEARPANAVLLECGHGGICYECGQGLVKQRVERSCPLCRVVIEHIIKLPEGSPCRIGQPVEVQEGFTVSVANLQTLFIPTTPTPMLGSRNQSESNSRNSSTERARNVSGENSSMADSREPPV